ncbi:MAG: hypothetical protein K2Q11_06045 [Burkholderiaceae bacterium]|nr:hypothetical protein [Burkholderiaceae bacterium]
MSDTSPFGFGKFVPGFDFLQNLAKGSTGNMPQMPNLSSWVAPTISVEELEKRITELQAVQFWLEQNSRALSATIQALEVQKMTLATLKGMNFSMGDVASAFKMNPADAMMGSVQKAGETFAGAAQAMTDAAARVAQKSAPAAAPAPAPAATPAPAPEAEKATASVIDPVQWWGALTQQFQQIATTAMAEVAKQNALDTTHHMATDLAKEAIKTATDIAAKGVETVQNATLRAASVVAPAAAAVKKTAARKATAATPAADAAAVPAAKKTPTRRAATKQAR